MVENFAHPEHFSTYPQFLMKNMENLDEMWTRIGSVTKNEVTIAVLKDEIELYKSRIEPTGTGYLYDAISQLKRRIEEIENG